MQPWMKPFSVRAEYFNNVVVKKLFDIATAKKSNLVLSADVTTQDQLLTFADRLGPHIAVLKTHIDMVADFDVSLIAKLKALASKHRFLIFEDRKFADIGSTVVEQCRGGIYRISDWADIINAHIISGPGIIRSLKMAYANRPCLLLLVAEMSAKGSLADSPYHEKAIAFSETCPDLASGFIAQRRLETRRDYLYFTPGVNLQQKTDNMDQQYRDPEQALVHDKADFIIVGRGITTDKDPEAKAQRYRELAWKALESRYV